MLQPHAPMPKLHSNGNKVVHLPIYLLQSALQLSALNAQNSMLELYAAAQSSQVPDCLLQPSPRDDQKDDNAAGHAYGMRNKHVTKLLYHWQQYPNEITH